MQTTTQVPLEQRATDDLINEYLKLKGWLEKAKLSESALRAYLASRLFSDQRTADGSYTEGTLKSETERAKAKLVQKRTYVVLEELMVATLKEAALTPDEGKGLIKTEFKLGVTAYKKLPDGKRALVDRMITIKPSGTVELDIELKPL